MKKPAKTKAVWVLVHDDGEPVDVRDTERQAKYVNEVKYCCDCRVVRYVPEPRRSHAKRKG